MHDTKPIAGLQGGASWVTRTHPHYKQLVDDQNRQRASFIASRNVLVPFLVPHRFEGAQDLDPASLRRALIGYGIGLNKSYLSELLGHVRGAAARYTWGPMSPEDEGAITGQPSADMARMWWQDVTRDGTTWRNLYLRKVLEWLLSSPGGVIVIDTPMVEGVGTLTVAQAKAKGLRPFQRFVPMSEIEDRAWGKTGYRWIKILEAEDERSPREAGDSDKRIRVLYELLGDGSTEISRWDSEGKEVGETVNIGKLVDQQLQPTLPIVRAIFGEHELIPHVGVGLIFDLADIVIDLFNTLSEVREGFRDAAFGIIVYRGEHSERVQQHLENGSRFIAIGEGVESDLSRVSGTTEEVTAGLAIIELGLRAWAWAARRKAADAMTRSSGGARSGTSLDSEFQLDLVPLLREIVGVLDQIESTAMYLVGQFAGHSPESLTSAGVGVERGKDFRTEEEAARIARVVRDFRTTQIRIPPELAGRIGEKWVEALDFVDLDEEITVVRPEGGEQKVTLREIIGDRFQSLAEIGVESERNFAAFGGPGGLGEFPET